MKKEKIHPLVEKPEIVYLGNATIIIGAKENRFDYFQPVFEQLKVRILKGNQVFTIDFPVIDVDEENENKIYDYYIKQIDEVIKAFENLKLFFNFLKGEKRDEK